jgi:hydantoinase/carbamoylase family amidase
MRLHEAIAELATFNDDPEAGGITREVFTPTYERALEHVARLMRETGLEVRRDAFGNLYGRLEGSEPSLPCVRTGSHFDTTLNAGAYDGVVGVLGAVAALGALQASGRPLRRAIEVVAFAGEEPRFGTGCIGSRAVMGDLSRGDLDRLVDRDGVSLAAALAGAGLDPDAIEEAAWDPAAVHAFLELHIEQGIVLESSGDQIGIVDAIAAPHDLRVTITGAADHAGATPMTLRRDALAGASEAMVELERLAAGSPSGTTVGTVGVLRLAPGAINVVPGVVELDVDVRDSDPTARGAVVDGFLAAVRAIAARRGLEVEVADIVRDEPRACAPFVVEACEQACASLGARGRHMISGAYHDALILARQVPVGMLFVPSRGGVSHHPDEHTDPEDIDRGAAVLGEALALLAR